MTTQRRASHSCLAVDAGGWPGPRPLAGRTPFSPRLPPPSTRSHRKAAPQPQSVCMAPPSSPCPLPPPFTAVPSTSSILSLHVTLDFFWGFLFRRTAGLPALPLPPWSTPLCSPAAGIQGAGGGVSRFVTQAGREGTRLPPFTLWSPLFCRAGQTPSSHPLCDAAAPKHYGKMRGRSGC